MKKAKVLVVLCCMLVLSFALAACASVDKTRYTGEWKLAYGSAENVSSDVVEAMGAFGLETTLTLDEDGTGELNLFGDKYSLTWSATSDSEGTIDIGELGEGSLKLANSELAVVNAEDETMTFTRDE